MWVPHSQQARGRAATGVGPLLLLCSLPVLGGAFVRIAQRSIRVLSITLVHKTLFNQKSWENELSRCPDLARWELAGISYVAGSIRRAPVPFRDGEAAWLVVSCIPSFPFCCHFPPMCLNAVLGCNCTRLIISARLAYGLSKPSESL